MKYGRKPRGHDPRVPHLSSLLAGKAPVIPPDSKDWTVGLPADFGMMMNDQIGCCGEAGYYHARQDWTANAGGAEITESDDRVVQLYQTQGYVPGDPTTDNGTNLQQLLTQLLNIGAPIGDGSTFEKLIAWLEVDPRNFDDVFRTIVECGGAYIGMLVPQTVTAAIANGDPIPNVWMGAPDPTAGHCVWAAAYDRISGEVSFVSWGSKFILPRSTWAQCVEECYALLDPAWIAATGHTPFGMTAAETEAAMSALKIAA